MQSTTQPIHLCPPLAVRFAALAALAPWRCSARLATLALGLGGLSFTAQAALQVYEPFDYTSGLGTTLNGQNGGTGFAAGSAWQAINSNTYPSGSPTGFAICDGTMHTLWNGTVTAVPQTGKFVGSPAPAGNSSSGYNGNNPDHEMAQRPLDPAVTASFTLGAVTWMSYVEASNFKANGNGTGGSFAIGQGTLYTTGTDNRGWTSYGGSAIGIGIDSGKKFRAAFWDGNAAGALTGTAGASWNTTGTPQISIAKITWGDATTATTIQEATFNDGTALTEAAFDAAAVSTSATFDPSTFTMLSLGGGRFNVDELRVGTTFNDAIGVVAVSYGNYWAAGASGGGSGNWDATTLDWAGVPNVQGTLGQSPTANLVFSGSAGTVTINGTASAAAGLQFGVDGYTLAPGTSTPKLSLAGANAAANTITVNTGSATISALVSGTNGLTKDGSGTLFISNTSNTYSGGTLINAGTLEISALGSLGSNVTFGGGTLQYPAGSGTSSTDVSGKLATVASPGVAKIDTNGNDVTFATAISGDGSLTKLGGGSLTLAAAAPSGGITVSGGTLNVSNASGIIATLNVPAGGTVNLGDGSVVTTLNITGGTVHITGANVEVGTLVGSSGVLEAATHALAVTTQATVGGVRLALAGAPTFALSGTNVIVPDASNHRVATATGGSLAFANTGLDVALGIAAPGVASVAGTATFSGNGAWSLHGGAAADIANFYGIDNHVFHYMQVPSGDFDIIAHVTGTTNASVGLMARDNLSAHVGDSAGIWTGLSATTLNGGITTAGPNTGGSPWLRVTKIGNVVTTSFSSNGISYTQSQQVDYSSHPWGGTTYLGLDLTATTGAVGSASGTYDNVNFMGTASMAELRTTDLLVSNSAQLNLDFGGTLRIGALSIEGTPQANGTYGSSGAATAPNVVDDTHFTGTGTLTLGKVTPVITWSDPAAINEGTALSATQLNAGSSAYGTLTYTPAAGALLSVGSQTLHVDFTPSDTDSYNTASKDVTLVVNGVPTPFSDWASANSLSGADAAFNADPDHDGLSNGIEFVLGGQPNPANPDANSSALLPTLTRSGGNVVFTFRRTAVAANDLGLVISAQYSSNLSGWTVAQDTVNGVSIVTTTDGFAAGVDKVEVTLPSSLAGTGPLFVRLQVTQQ